MNSSFRSCSLRSRARFTSVRGSIGYFLVDQQVRLHRARSDQESKLDRDVRWFLKIPHMLSMFFVRMVRVVDFFGFLPRSFIAGDPLFASASLANLGSVGGAAAFHRLCE